MLNGHIDIDPLAAGWTRDPFTPWIADSKLYGHGAFNMKAGVTACIMAALALKRSGLPLAGDVVVACVAAELNSGIGTLHALRHGGRTDMAVVAEPYGAQWLGGAALDVFEEEPLAKDSPLLRMDNVIVTPHAAYFSSPAVAQIPRRCGEEVARVFTKGRPLNVVNPEVDAPGHRRRAL